jgi:Astacin (Peptidase family M12A)
VTGGIANPFIKLAIAAQAQKDIIVLGLKDIEGKTCVRFIPRTTEVDWVQIYNGAGCSSVLGRTGGKQRVSMNKDSCIYKAKAAHEFMHVLGFTHMHNHFNRDKFVWINFDNINLSERSQFEKVNTTSYFNFDTTYDYLSATHYPRKAFSSNKLDTIVPTNSAYLDLIGNVKEISTGDAARIKNMYKC